MEPDTTRVHRGLQAKAPRCSFLFQLLYHGLAISTSGQGKERDKVPISGLGFSPRLTPIPLRLHFGFSQGGSQDSPGGVDLLFPLMRWLRAFLAHLPAQKPGQQPQSAEGRGGRAMLRGTTFLRTLLQGASKSSAWIMCRVPHIMLGLAEG